MLHRLKECNQTIEAACSPYSNVNDSELEKIEICSKKMSEFKTESAECQVI